MIHQGEDEDKEGEDEEGEDEIGETVAEEWRENEKQQGVIMQ